VTKTCQETNSENGKTQKLRLMLLNIQGLLATFKFATFENYILSLQKRPHVIAINEHWLCSQEVKNFNIKGYKLVSQFGRKKANRGGALILVSTNANFSVKRLSSPSIEGQLETAACEIKIKNKKITIINVYRPPNSTSLEVFYDHIENLIEKNLSPNGEMIIMGDFNINLLDKNRQLQKLTLIMEGYEMFLLNKNEPTRVTECSATLIDHIYASLTCKSQFKVVDINFSDHRAVHCELDIPIEDQKDWFTFSRKYTNENWLLFKNHLSSETWEEVCSENTVDKMCEIFMKKLVDYFERSFPLKRTVKRANQIGKVQLSAFTTNQKNELRMLGERIKAMRKMEREQQINKTDSELYAKSDLLMRLEDAERSQRNYVSFLINDEIRKKNDTKLKNSNNKGSMAWKIIKENMAPPEECSEVSSLEIEGEKEEDLQKIADFLNRKFVEPSPQLDPEQSKRCAEKIPMVASAFSLGVLTTAEEVNDVIMKMPAKKSSGWDGISMDVIRKIAPLIALPLSEIINKSFESGKFP
jgi:hypothetical protein